MKTWLVTALLAVAASPAQADALRCGTRLVTEGNTLAQVRAKCGEAAEVEHRSVWRHPVVWIHGRPFRVGESPIEIPVELWVYNLGPNKFMRRVHFEDGLVVKVETLGYGYRK
jgi:hypothetical protein